MDSIGAVQVLERPKVTAAKILCISLNVRDFPRITEDDLLAIFRTGSVPAIFHPRFEEFFYDCIRWGNQGLKRFMRENGLTAGDVANVFHSLPPFMRSERFQEALDSGELG